MRIGIGIFDHEEHVLNAVEALQEAGVRDEEIRVIVNNRETAPRLDSSSGVRLEALIELQELREEEDSVIAPLIAGYPGGGFMSGNLYTGNVAAGPALFSTESISGTDADAGDVMQAIGIPESAAKRCGQAAAAGNYVLIATADIELDSNQLLSSAGAIEVFQLDQDEQ